MRFVIRSAASLAIVALAVATMSGQSAPVTPLRMVTADGTRTIPTVLSGDTELVALDDLASIFSLQVRDDAVARAITVGYQGRTIVLSQDQALASIGGRLVSLPAPPARIGNRWHVPVEFIGRALSSIYDTPLELRKASRLVLRGRIRAPRVVVRHDVAGSQARISLDVAPRTGHQVVQEGARLLVRFEADLLDATIPPLQTQGLVNRIVVEQTTLAIELGPRFGSFRASDATVEPDATRIVIDLFTVSEQTGPTVAPPVTTEAPPPLPLPAPGVRTIVLDPGHGGDEQGAKGTGGTIEKTLTLALAQRLKAALESRLGARVLLTRDADRPLALDDRAAVANNNKADVFISLHANASLRRAASGAEVFYLSPDSADQTTSSEAVPMPVFGGGTREIDVILWETAQARHLARSADLARAIEAELRPVVPMSPRAIQQAPFRVLVGANMPAVLVEVGYLTNPTQESALSSAAVQTRLAQALTEAVATFFAANVATPSAAAPVSAQPR